MFTATIGSLKTPEKQALESFGAIIRTARVKKGHTQESLSAELDVHSTYITKIENGRAGTIPSDEMIDGLAKELSLDSDELRFVLMPAAAERIPEKFRQFLRIERAPEKANTTPLRSGRREEGRFPVYGLAACGTLAEAIKNDRLPHGEQRTTEPWRAAVDAAKSKHAFVVEAEGESMLDTIRPGDELLVDPKGRPKNGQVALVQIGGTATVKRWNENLGVIVLTPDNPDRKRFPEKAYSTDEFAAEGGIAWRVVLARSTRSL